jgi:hypothetical protein
VHNVTLATDPALSAARAIRHMALEDPSAKL